MKIIKNIFPCFLCLLLLSFTGWQTDFEKAKKLAAIEHRFILLNFSGSDWCGPCVRMRKEIFEKELFSRMADTCLVLVNADFPRNRKNQLDKAMQKQNDALADKYNSEGKFPFTVLLDKDGKLIKSWDGFPKGGVATFTKQIKNSCDANK